MVVDEKFQIEELEFGIVYAAGMPGKDDFRVQIRSNHLTEKQAEEVLAKLNRIMRYLGQ